MTASISAADSDNNDRIYRNQKPAIMNNAMHYVYLRAANLISSRGRYDSSFFPCSRELEYTHRAFLSIKKDGAEIAVMITKRPKPKAILLNLSWFFRVKQGFLPKSARLYTIDYVRKEVLRLLSCLSVHFSYLISMRICTRIKSTNEQRKRQRLLDWLRMILRLRKQISTNSTGKFPTVDISAVTYV